MDSQEPLYLTKVDMVRKFACDHEVFSLKQLADYFEDKSLKPIPAVLVSTGELMVHATGIYSLQSIPSDDPKVVDLIQQTGAKPISAVRRRKIREANTDRIRAEMAAKKKLEDKFDNFRRWSAKTRIFLKAQVEARYGTLTSILLRRMFETGEIISHHKGILCVPSVDPMGAELKEMVRRKDAIFAEITREIDAFLKRFPMGPVNLQSVTFRHWKQGKMNRVYIKIKGLPEIYATCRSNQTYYASHEKIDSEGISYKLSREAVYSIACRIFDEPPPFSDLQGMINSKDYVPEPQARCGEYAPIVRPAAERTEPYGLEDAEMLDPANLTIPLSEPIVLKVDSREPDAIFAALHGIPNLIVQREELEFGDYVVPGKLVIERKTTDDLKKSLLDTDNRLSRQVAGMRAMEGCRILLVEGGIYKAPSKTVGLRKRLTSRARLAVKHGIPVIDTLNMRHTVYEIVLLVREIVNASIDGETNIEPMPARPITQGARAGAMAMLRAVGGIGVSRSQTLINRFGTLPAVMEHAKANGVLGLLEAIGTGCTYAEASGLYEALLGIEAPQIANAPEPATANAA